MALETDSPVIATYGSPQVQLLRPSGRLLVRQIKVDLSDIVGIDHLGHDQQKPLVHRRLMPLELTCPFWPSRGPVGGSIMPSTMTCATCTACGPNSFARLWVNARRANIAGAMVENGAPPRMAIVAPVKMSTPFEAVSVSGLFLRNNGMRCWAKLNADTL